MKWHKSLIFVFLSVLIVGSSILLNNYLKQETINTFNKQAQLELRHIKSCFNSVSGNPVERLDKCASNSLVGGNTGDVFAVDLKTMKIIWDNSVDCKTSKVMYLSKNSVCKLASNPQSCINLAKQIKKGYNGSYKWQFDDSPEYDNWIVLPDETHNFDGTSRAIYGVKDQIVVVQGFQEDEVMKSYKYLVIVNKIVTSIILLGLIVLYLLTDRFCILKKEEENV